jgi:hypothetical protein
MESNFGKRKEKINKKRESWKKMENCKKKNYEESYSAFLTYCNCEETL